MIPEAREVHLSRKDRKVLEACCRSPMTLQRDLKRARIVLLAAAGRSTRSIAKEVGVQPRIVSLWRHRFADLGLQPRPNSNCFEGSAAQNSKFVKYGAGGRSSVPVENGFGTASELSTRNECSRPSAAFPRLERLGCPARRSSGARY